MLLHGVPGNARIGITGIGAILPDTYSVHDFWSHIRDGTCTLGYLDRFDTSDFAVKVAAQIRDFDYRGFLPKLSEKYASRYSRDILAFMSALEQARTDADIHAGAFEPGRMGIIASTSRGPLEWWCDQLVEMPESAGNFEAHDMLPGLASMPASLAAIYSGIQGMVMTLSSACVGGYQSIHVACRELESGGADVMFVGGYDFPLFRPMLEIYHANNLLSQERDSPSEAMKPYDRRRDGFAFGEGALVIALERIDHARARGARIYAEIFGIASMNEALHPTSMDLTGEVTAGLIKETLAVSRRSIGDVDYFCGHGTATRYNDLAEGRAIKALYGDVKRDAWAPMSSVKPIYGHTMGASGVMNAAASALMLHRQCLCPTINLREPDPECDWDHITEGPRETPLETIVSMSFAIGSQTALLTMGTPQ